MVKKKINKIIQRIKCFFGKHDISRFVFIYENKKMYSFCRYCRKLIPTDKPFPKGPWHPIR